MIQESHIKWVNDRKEKFTYEQKRVYSTITPQMKEIYEVKTLTLTQDELQFVWDTICQEDHDKNEETIREYARLHPNEIRALGEYLEGRRE